MSIYQDYIDASVEKKAIEDRINNLKAVMWNDNETILQEAKDTGIVNAEKEGFKIKITKKENVKVDQELAAVVGVGFKKEYKLSKAAYNELSDTDKKRVDECITTKPGKPTFEVERIEE